HVSRKSGFRRNRPFAADGRCRAPSRDLLLERHARSDVDACPGTWHHIAHRSHVSSEWCVSKRPVECDLRAARSARWYDRGLRRLERYPEGSRRTQVFLGLASAGVEPKFQEGVAMPTIAPDENTVASIDWQQNDLYRFFAVVFAPPTRKCFDLLS